MTTLDAPGAALHPRTRSRGATDRAERPARPALLDAVTDSPSLATHRERFGAPRPDPAGRRSSSPATSTCAAAVVPASPSRPSSLRPAAVAAPWSSSTPRRGNRAVPRTPARARRSPPHPRRGRGRCPGTGHPGSTSCLPASDPAPVTRSARPSPSAWPPGSGCAGGPTSPPPVRRRAGPRRDRAAVRSPEPAGHRLATRGAQRAPRAADPAVQRRDLRAASPRSSALGAGAYAALGHRRRARHRAAHRQRRPSAAGSSRSRTAPPGVRCSPTNSSTAPCWSAATTAPGRPRASSGNSTSAGQR